MYVTSNGNPCLVNGFNIAQLPFMALFCLNVTGQFHARPGIGTEKEALGMAAGWERLSSIKIRHPDASLIRISRLVLPWSLGSSEEPHWCLSRPQVTLLFQKTSVLSKILVTASTPGLLPRQNKNEGRDACPPRAPLNELNTKRPEAMLHLSLQVCRMAASLSSVAAIAIVLLCRLHSQNTWFWWVSRLPGSVKQLLY